MLFRSMYALMKAYPQILDIFKWIGGLYLIYLAINFLKRKTSIDVNQNINTRSSYNLFKDGFISALFSPGALVFFLVMFPTFLDPNNNFLIHFIILLITHVSLDFFFLATYAGIASKISNFLKNYPNLISRLSGCILMLLAYKILSTKINL